MICDNHRRTAVTITFNKSHAEVLKDLMEKEYNHLKGEEECGFGTSYMDILLTIKQVIEK